MQHMPDLGASSAAIAKCFGGGEMARGIGNIKKATSLYSTSSPIFRYYYVLVRRRNTSTWSSS